MPAGLGEFDRLIAGTERAILEQVFRILAADAAGESTVRANRASRAVEDILAEHRRARNLIVEARWLTESETPTSWSDPNG